MPRMDTTGLPKKINSYLVDCMYCTDYNEEIGEINITSSLTLKGKLQFIANALNGEAMHEYNLKRFKNNVSDILADHLQGLPSWLNVDFENYKILEKGKEWGYDLSTEKKEDAFIEKWFPMCAHKIMQMLHKEGVSVKKYSLDKLDFNDGFKKIEAKFEDVQELLKDNKRFDAVPHEDSVYIYFNGKNKDLSSELNTILEPLLADKSLNSIVKAHEQKEFDELNKNDLEYLGFKKSRDLRLGDEYQVEFSHELLTKLKDVGFDKTWGHEGLTTSYAVFVANNILNEESFGKSFISIRENSNAVPKFTNTDESNAVDNNEDSAKKVRRDR